jgi:septum formation protein
MLVLASNSPRRKRLLSLTGLAFTVIPAEIDEREFAGETPAEYVLRLAESKARAVASKDSSRSLVIAADTTVADAGEILGKPRDEAEAERMLRRLRGREHQVYTALAVMHPSDGKLICDLCITNVPMRNYSDEEMYAYIATGDPLDKAGAYAIQHAGFRPVRNLQGCYANVVGLPLCHLTRVLASFDVHPKGDLPAACQQALGYRCPVFEDILSETPVGCRDEDFASVGSA